MDVMRACEGSLQRLGTEYLDLYLIHWPNPAVPLEDTFAGLNALVESGKVRHLGVSNFDRHLLARAQSASKTPLLTNQIPYSIAERSCEKNGVLEYCQSADILVTAYSPLQQGNMSVTPELLRIAVKRSVSPHQVAIAWLCSRPRVITIPMSADPSHQRANLEAADVVLSPDEIAAICA
jgi:diketogulonate reductase-like aldo/keto reductase